MSNQAHIAETLGNNLKVFSIFIDNLPKNLSITNSKDLFSSFGEVSDAYIQNKFVGKTSKKRDFI